MARYKRIRDLREDFSLTQAQIAKALGLYTTTYARYESGEREIPFNIAIRIAQYYNVSLDFLASQIE